MTELRELAPVRTAESIIPLGPLAAALAKAQSEFGAITRDKEVVVQKKAGGQYRFKYAPLDQILGVVRGPLSKNGLALVQLLDPDALVTMLVHESGATLEARTPIPSSSDIQSYGSAITYLRRYAVQAMLGIAAEEDDDGNAQDGNQAAPAHETPQVGSENVTLIGIDTLTGDVKKGTSDRYLCEWREAPDGAWVIGFAMKRASDGQNYPQVGVMGSLADALRALHPDGTSLVGQHLKVRGRFYAVRTVLEDGKLGKAYSRVIVGQGDGDFIETSDLRIPPLADPEQAAVDAVPVAEGQEALFDAAESARIDEAEAARA